MGLLDRIEEEESVEETPVEKPKQEKEKKPRRSRRSKAAKSEDTPVATAEKPRKNPK